MKTNPESKAKSNTNYDFKTMDAIALRAHFFASQMIYIANHRTDKEKGDPKVGGHPAASASSLYLLGALHLAVKTGYDHMAVKPHTSPTDHAYNHLLNLLLDEHHEPLSPESAEVAMQGLRKFSQNGEPVFQSYHSHWDPDHHNFLPSGTVGIPPVQAGYLALAYRYAKEHNFEVPPAHFWCLLGDSEFREGSLYEAMPDFAEREIGNLTWIVDYNRQSLDGQRLTNADIMNGTDDKRLARTAIANGWEVIVVQHGQFRQELFKKKNGPLFKVFLEDELEDYQFQALLLSKDMKASRAEILKTHKHLKPFLDVVSDDDLYRGLRDLGGHDFKLLTEAYEASKLDTRRPTMVIAHTLKGWGLRSAAVAGNHNSMLNDEEMNELRERAGLTGKGLFERFEPNSKEGQFLSARREKILSEMKGQWALGDRNRDKFGKDLNAYGAFPKSLNINTKLVSYPHTQWMMGQLTAKLTRIANTSMDGGKLQAGQKALSPEEKTLKLPGELLISMAPDVGTSTNLNPAMDGKVFGAHTTEDYESDLNVKDDKMPDLIAGEEVNDRFLRFEIAEGNVMSCVGSFGQLRDLLGIPIIPLMTVYDFFLKRALDQYFYNLYWKSSFIAVGTPSGVTLSPEGAQHGWKSDFQIPNQITWEPFFCFEMDLILTDAIRRHLFYDNEGRSGVLIRGVTRGVDQSLLMKCLKMQARFKAGLEAGTHLHPAGQELAGATDESTLDGLAEEEILRVLGDEVLRGAYRLIDYRGYAGYEPGDNVVNIFAMGAMGTEAIKASDALREKGIYANVIMVTSSDLLVGTQAHQDDYALLKTGLGIETGLYLKPFSESGISNYAELMTLAGRRVPIVSVHDGEPGLLDNIGSLLALRHEALAVRKHSKCGRPSEIYRFHKIDADAVVDAVGKVLSETALERVEVSPAVAAQLTQHLGDQLSIANGQKDALNPSVADASTRQPGNWQDLWPSSRRH